MLKYVTDKQTTKNRLARKNAIYATKKGLSEVNRKALKARPKGFEPPTLGSEDRCAIQLSHGRYFADLTTAKLGSL